MPYVGCPVQIRYLIKSTSHFHVFPSFRRFKEKTSSSILKPYTFLKKSLSHIRKHLKNLKTILISSYIFTFRACPRKKHSACIFALFPWLKYSKLQCIFNKLVLPFPSQNGYFLLQRFNHLIPFKHILHAIQMLSQEDV